jgi:D-amino-acid dehydrogenase
MMKSFGLDRDAISVDEAVRIEPALAACRDRLVGATYTATDESGDAHVFTQKLANLAETQGKVDVRYGQTIQGLRFAGGEVKGVVVKDAEGKEATLTADAYVVALGSYSPLLTRPVGIDLPIYPAKGYSASVPIADESKAPTVSLTDDSAKIVVTRLGNRLRIAGTAELAGYNTDLNPVRCEALIKRVAEFFPGAGEYDQAKFWTGLRPSTPSNVPLVGRTKVANLWLNTGHGTLGWTMACGSGRALADLMSGRKPEVDFEFTK